MCIARGAWSTMSVSYTHLDVYKRQVVDYMKSRGISAFYLFTDTSCNYPFYEHLGLTRRCEKKQVVDVKGEQGEMTFFLYDYPCEMAKPDGPVGVQEEGLL